jgi:hypothetical protein
MIMFDDYSERLNLTNTDQGRFDRRLARLAATEPMIEGAERKLRGLGRRWPGQVHIRPRFVFRRQPAPGDASDRRLPARHHRPPATRLLSPSGIALRFYLIALFEAQMRTKAGGRPANDIPLVAGGDDTSWIDLIAVPVEAQGNGLYRADRSTKKQRRVESALRTLSQTDVQLVHLPHEHQKSGKYKGFQLRDEGGARTDGDVPLYTVPDKKEQVFSLPSGLFSNGWIHLLEDTELAFLMMVALVAQHGKQGAKVKISSDMRLLHYGLGRDAYEAHKTLDRFGLVAVEIDDDRHMDGTVENFSNGGTARLHAFQLLPDGFDEPAATTIKKTLAQEQPGKAVN